MLSAISAGLRFAAWLSPALQVGMAVEMHQDDVWWKGLALRTTPAGMHVYLPGGRAHLAQQQQQQLANDAAPFLQCSTSWINILLLGT